MPAGFERLPELAMNLWWSWHPGARELFRRLDETLWRRTRHNAVLLLYEIAPPRLADTAADPIIQKLYRDVVAAFDETLQDGGTWCSTHQADLSRAKIAFFSAEYGLHNSLPLYAGGLGVLAGDIAKEASDLGLPFVGIGFMYPQGYFRQKVTADGRQEEVYEHLDRNHAAISLARRADGEPFRISLTLPDRVLHIGAWRILIGRSVLYLMDTDLDENAPWDRELTGRLYGGDQNARLLQEIVLGIGGVRLLRALGIEPAVWHGNEGHTALMMVERVRERLSAGATFDTAVEDVRKTTVFTTHTPVPAGHDAFPFEMAEGYFSRLEDYGAALEPHRGPLLALASYPAPWGQGFNMTALGLRLSAHVNGVSRKHGEVSREMWHPLWPDLPVDKVPIGSITNGVHVPTWVSGEMDRLYRQHLSPDWLEHQDDPSFWEGLASIPDQALWVARRKLKVALLQYLRERIRQRWSVDHTEPGQAMALGALLDPDALTIGFARRFASYKRATLLLRDPKRLAAILNDERRPVQILFAGKAHPADGYGKDLLQAVYHAARDPLFAGRIAFVENYGMHTAHWLVQGVDLWLNNPRAPLEACGTSGMKAGMNGVPSLSVLDGWWIEAYDGQNGWAFGGDSESEDADARDAEELYGLLEQRIVPLYYEREANGIPRGWLAVVRRILATVTPAFSARRMMKEYTERMYVPAIHSIGTAKEPTRPAETRAPS